MMREILFRGKTTRTNLWVYGHYSTNYGTGRPEIRDKAECCFVEVIPETVGQYTGLTDKNDKKIFEGDILNGLLSLHPDRRIFQVGYEDNGFYFFDEDEVGWHPDHIVDYEVIGNIHDNPELLKGE